MNNVMQALVFDGAPRVIEKPVPEPPPGEALIRVTRGGICSTDRELVRGYMGFSGTLGHEFVGVVERAGDAPDWVGRRVVGEINCVCGECVHCRAGRPRHCTQRTVLGIQRRDGAFANYTTLPIANLHAVPDSVDDDTAVFTEPVAAAFRILEQMDIAADARVAVLGDGKLGQLIARVLRTRTEHLVAVGRQPWKRALLEEAGITAVSSDEDLPRDFDVVVEATGAPNGLARALSLVRCEGTVVLKNISTGDTTWLVPRSANQRGCFSPDGREVAVPLNGRIRIVAVDGSTYRDLLTAEGSVRVPGGGVWLHWLPNGYIYWGGGHGDGWHSWTGPHDRIFRVNVDTEEVDTLYRGTDLYWLPYGTGEAARASFTTDGTIAYRHRRWDLTGEKPMVNFIGHCSPAMSPSGQLVTTTHPAHDRALFYSGATLEECCTTTPYTDCFGGGCVDGKGCPGSCTDQAHIDDFFLDDIWNTRWATPAHAGDAWLTATKGMGGEERAYLFNRETGQSWTFYSAHFGRSAIMPCDFWPGPLPDNATPAIRLGYASALFFGDSTQTVSLTNAGGGSLGELFAATTSSWLGAAVEGTGNAQTLTVTATVAGLASGIYRDTVTITGGGALTSARFTVTLSVEGALLPPSDLITTLLPDYEGIALSWTAQTTDEDGFIIERSTATSPWSVLTTAAGGTSAHEDRTLTTGGMYSYRLRAWRGNDTTAYSETATIPYVSATSLVITAPLPGSHWTAGTDVTITWNAGDDVGTVGIDLSLDGGENYLSVLPDEGGSVAPHPGELTIRLPQTASDDAYIQIWEYGNPLGARASSGPFSIVPSSRTIDRSAADAGGTHHLLQVGTHRIALDLHPGERFSVSLYSASGRVLAHTAALRAGGTGASAIALPATPLRGLVICVIETSRGTQVHPFAWMD